MYYEYLKRRHNCFKPSELSKFLDATGEVQPTLNKHRPYLQRLGGPDHEKSRPVSCRDMPAHT